VMSWVLPDADRVLPGLHPPEMGRPFALFPDSDVAVLGRIEPLLRRMSVVADTERPSKVASGCWHCLFRWWSWWFRLAPVRRTRASRGHLGTAPADASDETFDLWPRVWPERSWTALDRRGQNRCAMWVAGSCGFRVARVVSG